MNCSDVAKQVLDRRRREEDPPEWAGVLDHLERCPTCRREAVALDPCLILRQLPERTPDRAEVEEMVAAVSALVRAQRVTGRSGPLARVRAMRPLRAAAAAVALGLLWGRPAPEPQPAGGVWVEAGLPVVDAIENPEARVYQLGDEQVAVVLIVDANLEV